MEFKVPQNVQREDKILGPLTIKGFIICGGGFGLMYISYLIFSDVVYPIIDLIILVLTILFTFVKIHDMTFFNYILAMILFYFKPQKRVWVQHSGNFSMDDLITTTVEAGPKKEEKKDDKDKPTLDELANILDKGGYSN